MGQAAMVGKDAPVVRVQDFVKRYRKQMAVDGASLSIDRGEIYGLIGPDGAGKSSLMKAIAGVLSFDGGTLHIFGEKIDSEAAAERVKGRLGFMPQGLGLNLYPELSVEENIDFFAELRDVPPAELAQRKHKLLAMTRLDNFRDRPMKQLSGGMKQKLGLVCTLIHEPELIILDEPTTGVDPVSRRDFWMILTQLLRERGVTALVSTAYMDEAARFHRLSLMFDGRVLIEGEPDTILREVPGALVELVAEPQVEALLRLKTRFPQAEAVGPKLRVFVPGATPQLARAQVEAQLEGLMVSEMQAVAPELEDAFIALLQQRQPAGQDDARQTQVWLDGDPPKGDGIAIAARELSRDFDHFRAVDRVSFEVRQGEIFGLLGANGAGKTTAYPSTYWDHSEASPFESIRAYGIDYGLTAANIEDYMTLYEPDLDKRKDPYISPLLAADLSGQPETLIITAEFDPLRDEGEAYGEALQRAGNRVRVRRIPDAAHGFIAYPKFARPVVEAYKEINAFLGD